MNGDVSNILLIALPFSIALFIDTNSRRFANVRDRSHMTSGFCSGMILGSAFFIFIGRAIVARDGRNIDTVLALSGLGFVLALLIQRVSSSHSVVPEQAVFWRSWYGRLGLALAIGFSIRISAVCGAIVAVALMSCELGSTLSPSQPVVPASASIARNSVGLAVALLLGTVVSRSLLYLPITLPILGGCFLYFGASISVPESHHSHNQWPTLGTTIAGALLVFFAVR